MAEELRPDDSGGGDQFSQEAEGPSYGLAREFVDFLLHNKKWWLVPIILVLLLVGVLVMLSATGLGSFIYPFL